MCKAARKAARSTTAVKENLNAMLALVVVLEDALSALVVAGLEDALSALVVGLEGLVVVVVVVSCSGLISSTMLMSKRVDWLNSVESGKFSRFGSTLGMSEEGTPIHWAKPNHTPSQLVVGSIRPRPMLTSLSASLSFWG